MTPKCYEDKGTRDFNTCRGCPDGQSTKSIYKMHSFKGTADVGETSYSLEDVETREITEKYRIVRGGRFTLLSDRKTAVDTPPHYYNTRNDDTATDTDTCITTTTTTGGGGRCGGVKSDYVTSGSSELSAYSYVGDDDVTPTVNTQVLHRTDDISPVTSSLAGFHIMQSILLAEKSFIKDVQTRINDISLPLASVLSNRKHAALFAGIDELSMMSEYLLEEIHYGYEDLGQGRRCDDVFVELEQYADIVSVTCIILQL